MSEKLTYKELEERVNKLQKALSEKEKTESDLRKALHQVNQFREALDNVSAHVYMKDTQHRYFYANNLTLKLFGCNAQELVGKGDEKFFPPDAIKKLHEVDKRVFKGECTQEEINIVHENGGRTDYIEVKAPLYETGTKEKIIGLCGISTDITEHNQLRDALKDSESLFRSYFELPLIGIAITSPEKGWVKVNQRLCEMLGYTNEEFESKTWSELTHPDDLSADIKQFNRVLAGQIETYSLDKRFIRKNKDIVFCSLSVGCVRNHDGSVKYFVALLQDITDRILAEQKHAKLEEQLQQSQKMNAIGTLAGGIAHDFNNMLGVITGNISYALSDIEKNEEIYEALADAQEGVKQAQKLTHQLITFAKGGAPIKKMVNIKKVIEESTKFVLRGTKAQCDFIFPNDLWPVEVDLGQINQVFTNLILNANQAMPDGGTIHIQAENAKIDSENIMLLEPGQYVKIMVTDQGVGISEKHFLKIFDPYFSTKQSGKGLGLATTHSIIKKHNGYIFAESQLDKGTTFHLYLPATTEPVEQVEKTEYVSYKGEGRILIMDDQESILKISGRMLNLMGYETVFATDGAQAIKLYREAYKSEKPFNAVILDLTVPGGMGGAKTIPELLKIDPKVKAVVSSGYSNDPIMSNYEDYGFCSVVPKPYTKNQLAEVLNKIFDKKG
ncbi:MAG: PAS domain S-box protein [Desulfobacteraceae bacterium]|nr:PAS domain S-box protein [Desulfobacteraceae bacterium]